jgi:hypothetical protein
MTAIALIVAIARTVTIGLNATTSVETVLHVPDGPLLLSIILSLPQGTQPKGHSRYGRPLALWDVYVDDFLGQVKCALLHTLDTLIRPLDAQYSQHHQEPASTKKMVKGVHVGTQSKTSWVG